VPAVKTPGFHSAAAVTASSSDIEGLRVEVQGEMSSQTSKMVAGGALRVT
jgi:hypothetical protein